MMGYQDPPQENMFLYNIYLEKKGLVFLFFFYNARSERELIETIPERIDWFGFLGYILESPIPDHSVLSKARNRWGQDVFKHFFEHSEAHKMVSLIDSHIANTLIKKDNGKTYKNK